MKTRKTIIRIYPLLLMLILIVFSVSCEKDDDDNNNNPISGTVTDIEGNEYGTISIGDQVWMVENLKTTLYNDGSIIPDLNESSEWLNDTTGGYCWYDKDEDSNKDSYGALYNWYSVKDPSKNLCPVGWHLPSDTEWTKLMNYAGGEGESGSKLKDTTSTGEGEDRLFEYWKDYNPNFADSYGFKARGGGNRFSDGSFGYFQEHGHWWSSKENFSDNAEYWAMFHNSNGFRGYSASKNNGFSIRCIKD